MVDLATLVLSIDTAPLEAGVARGTASTERLKSTFTGLHQTMERTPIVFQSLVEGHQRVSQELARTATATVGFTAKNQEAIDPLEKLRAELLANFNATKAYADRVEQATAAARAADAAAASSAAGFAKLRAPLQTAAIAMAGLPGPAGRVVSVLGQFALGGGLMLGVTAGMALFTHWLDGSREEAEKAEEPYRRAAEALERFRQAQRDPVDVIGESVGLVTERLVEQERVLRGLLGLQAQLERDGIAMSDVFRAKVEEAQQLVLDSRARLLAGGLAGQEEIRKTRDEAERAARERARQLDSLAAAELALEEKLARYRGDAATADAASIQQRLNALERQIEAADRLTASEQERLRNAGLVTIALEEQHGWLKQMQPLLDRLWDNPEVGRFQREQGLGSAGELGTNRVRGANLSFDGLAILREGQARADALAAALGRAGVMSEEYQDALEAQLDAQERARRGVIDLVSALGVAPRHLLEVADAISDLMRVSASRDVPLTLQNVGNAELSGGGLRATDFLGLAGAAIGFVGSLVDARRQAEIEAARMRAATADWERSLSRFADSIDGQSRLRQELQSLEDQFLALAEQAAARHGVIVGGDALAFTSESIAQRAAAIEGLLDRIPARYAAGLERELGFLKDLARVRELEAKAIDATRKALAEEEYAYRQELAARLASGEGRTRDAEMLRLQLRQREEMQEAQRKGYDLVTQAILAQVQALEAERTERELALALKDKHESMADLSRELEIRELELRGDTYKAESARIDDQHTKALNRVQIQFLEGLISPEDVARWNKLLDAEAKAAKDQLDQRIRDAEEATRVYNRLAQEDLKVRELTALGRDGAAADLRLFLDQERELRSLWERGATDATLALLLQVQELERLKVANDRLSQAEADRLALLEKERETQERLAKATEDRLRAERRLGQDLDVRYLTALGQQEAADDLRRQVQNARELEEAQNAGFSQTMIDFLRQVQEAERVRDLQDREDRLAAAIDPERALRPERTTSFDGRSITSSQADTMAAYLATIAINTGQLVRLSGGQPTTLTRGATGAGGLALGGGSLSITINPASGETPGQALDRVLANQGQLEAAASGTPPAL